jgi:hypothetical protein
MPSANVVGSGGLRSRKIDFKKNMQVFKYTEVDDIVESVEHRLLPVVSTGVEKEEEKVRGSFNALGTPFTSCPQLFCCCHPDS